MQLAAPSLLRHLRRRLTVLALTGASAAASAAPVTLSFNGSVGSDDGLLFAQGTAASFSIRFDDSALATTGAQVSLGPVVGEMAVGAEQFTFSSGTANTMFSNPNFNVLEILGTGTGPTTTYGHIFDILELDLKPSWEPLTDYLNALQLRYRYTILNQDGSYFATGFSYVWLDGTLTASVGGSAVPEPTTAWLLVPALAALGLGARRRRAGTA